MTLSKQRSAATAGASGLIEISGKARSANERDNMPVKEVFQTAVKKQINGNRQHGWGSKDSLEVILALLAEETGATIDDIKKESAELVDAINQVINPSQFRQKLESAKMLDEAVGRAAKTKSNLLQFGS